MELQIQHSIIFNHHIQTIYLQISQHFHKFSAFSGRFPQSLGSALAKFGPGAPSVSSGESSLSTRSQGEAREDRICWRHLKEVPGLYQGSLRVQRRTGHATLQDATEMGSEDASWLAWGTNKNRLLFHAFQHLLMQVSKGFTRDRCTCPNVLNWTYGNNSFFLHLWLQSILHLTRDLMIFFLLRPHFNLAWMAKRPPF